jgi:hypothetical protein
MLLVVGCGDSNEDFIITGNPNNNPTATTGNLTFQFTQGQAVTVPVGTTLLTFDFFDSVNPSTGDLVFTDTQDYASSVTVEDVPVSAVSVVITAYGADGVPRVTITDEVAVSGGGTVAVDLSDAVVAPVSYDSLSATPATVSLNLANPGAASQQLTLVGSFGNGDTVTFNVNLVAANGDFSSSPAGVVSITDQGLVNAVANGTTTVTASYTIGSVTRTDTVAVTVTGGIIGVDSFEVTPPTPQTLFPGQSTGAPVATFTPAGEAGAVVAAAYTISGDASLSVNASTGVVTAAAGALADDSATVTATYTDPGNDVPFTDTFVVTVVEPVPTTISFANVPGDTLDLPNGFFTMYLRLQQNFSDGSSEPIDPMEAQGNFQYFYGNAQLVTVVDGPFGAEMTTCIDPFNADPLPPVIGPSTGTTFVSVADLEGNVLDTFQLNVIAGGFTTAFTIPASITVVEGEQTPVQMFAFTTSGHLVDVTFCPGATIAPVIIPQGMGDSVITYDFTQGVLLGVTAGGATAHQVNLTTLNGALTAPYGAEFDVTVTPAMAP